MCAMAVQQIDPATARAWIAQGQAALIDVREPDEAARERIPGARPMPLSRFDVNAVPAGRLVLHCKAGQRSLDAAGRLIAGGREEVYSLSGGIEAWRRAGLPVEADRAAPLPIMRQVQIVAGGCVLAASILAAAASPWFLVLSGFFGAGLLFAGLSGWCGMARLLGAMPWNRHAGARRGCDISGGGCAPG
jgi:rhodanese-related sulfurtransferase